MGVENSAGSQTLCYINALGQEECFRNEYSTENTYEMGFDVVAKNQAHRAMVLQNLLEEEEDKLKLFGNTLITREQLSAGLPDGHCFQVHFNDEHQDMREWVCRDDLDHFWNHKCMFGVCDDVDELHKLFLGQCVNVHDSVLCP